MSLADFLPPASGSHHPGIPRTAVCCYATTYSGGCTTLVCLCLMVSGRSALVQRVDLSIGAEVDDRVLTLRGSRSAGRGGSDDIRES